MLFVILSLNSLLRIYSIAIITLKHKDNDFIRPCNKMIKPELSGFIDDTYTYFVNSFVLPT